MSDIDARHVKALEKMIQYVASMKDGDQALAVARAFATMLDVTRSATIDKLEDIVRQIPTHPLHNDSSHGP